MALLTLKEEESLNKLVKDFAKRLFKCHLIMFFISFIFTFFFGGFLGVDKPVNGYIFSGFVTLGYGFLLYSESLIEARKNFYNEKGVRENIDMFLGFKSGAVAHIITFLLVLIIFVLYYTYKWFNVTVWAGEIPLHIYLNTAFRFWMLPFLSFFPNSDSVNPFLYILFSAFPSVVCGISYIKGMKECKTVSEMENNK